MANPRIEVEIGAVIDGLKKGFGESVKIIDTLEKQAQDLEKALRDATDLDTIQNLNNDLLRTRSALAQLRTTGIDPLTRATRDYNSVGINFARLIQDAPFGILGVANNITSLSESFEQARGKGQSFTQILGSIFSAGNLLTLGLSLATSAFVAYQQGAFDSLFANEELNKSFKDLAQSVKSATANVAGELAQINALRGIIEDETASRQKREEAFERLQKKYPAIFTNGEKEKALNGQLTKSYDLLTKAIIQRAEASIAEQELPNLVKQKQFVDAELTAKQKLLKTELELLNTRNKLTPLTQTFSGSDFEQAQRRIKDLQQEVSGLSVTQKGLQINIDGFTESIVSYAEEFQDLVDPLNKDLKKTGDTLEDLAKKWSDNEDAILRNIRLQRQLAITSQQAFENVASRLTGKEGDVAFANPIQEAQNKIAQALTDGPPVKEFVDKLDKVKEKGLELQAAFSGLGSLLGRVFGKNPALGQFLGQFIGFAAKLIATNFKIATANAITGASNAAVATGPAAPFTLPAFIAGAIGVIGSAFALIGGRGGGGGGSSVGSSGVGGGSSFVGGAQGFGFAQNREIRGELVARGQDLVYVFNEANTRINKG